MIAVFPACLRHPLVVCSDPELDHGLQQILMEEDEVDVERPVLPSVMEVGGMGLLSVLSIGVVVVTGVVAQGGQTFERVPQDSSASVLRAARIDVEVASDDAST